MGPDSPRKRKRSRSFFYTVDVLSDGSEGTGDSSLFVSVYKESPYVFCSQGNHATVVSSTVDVSQRAPAPIARYAIGGWSDVAVRLAVDQRLSLGATRALLVSPTHHATGSSNSEPQGRGLEGFPGLLHSLHQAGAAQLTVVMERNDDDALQAVQNTVELILPSYRSQHPRVQLCGVPDSQTDGGSLGSWWNVYQDEYVVSHAKRIALRPQGGETSTPTAVLYLITCCCNEDSVSSLLVFPGHVDAEALVAVVRELPMVCFDTQQTTKLAWAMAVQGGASSECSLQSLCRKLEECWVGVKCLYTRPCPEGAVDPGLLVRAQQQSRAWHAAEPQFFPWNETSHPKNIQEESSPSRLRTGWSVILSGDASEPAVLVDRMLLLKQAKGERLISRQPWSMQYTNRAPLVTRDENEIDLGDYEESESDSHEGCRDGDTSTVAELLVLGTGCASPSPHRGSSGYCLFLNDDSTFVFEVGDGFMAQWYRYSDRSLLSIRVIWISHPHWDHYGGLASLLYKMARARDGEGRKWTLGDEAKQQHKEVASERRVPLVVAPGKILKYLGMFFGREAASYFYAMRMGREAKRMTEASQTILARSGTKGCPSQLKFFNIVPVDHSCADSFGFVMGLQNPHHSSLFVFCFSGDTRPCINFVEVCRKQACRWNGGIVDMLLHEATFDASEAQMSVAKKHSTLQEAIAIGQSVRARVVLLTHFSQRYESPADSALGQPANWMPVHDGLQLQLSRV